MDGKSSALAADELAAAADAEMAAYCEEHPRSPSASIRPKLMRRGQVWIALFGSTLEEGIAGIGHTIQSALRAFDVQYRNATRHRG